jgi:hypothetical protein
MTPLETSLEQAGLKPTGAGVKLSAYGPHWLHDSPLLEDFTLDEADIVGAGMFGARAMGGAGARGRRAGGRLDAAAAQRHGGRDAAHRRGR